MPYITKSDRDILKDGTVRIDNVGDFNYLFTLAYLKVWLKEGNQRYKTIHALRMAVIFPDTLLEVKQVQERLSMAGAHVIDLSVARELAFLEFYRRVAAEYEDIAIVKNGDLPEYERAIELNFELAEKIV
jgi:hypothetical protein